MYLGLQNEKSLNSSSSVTEAVLFSGIGSGSGSDFTERFFTARLFTGLFSLGGVLVLEG